jgi:hypothetical protein
MAFVRVNPGGWAVGAQLTSAQQNALDIDHANALDKTAAGDTLAGTIQVPPGTGFNVTGTGIAANALSAVNGIVAGSIRSNVVGAIQLAGGPTDNITFFPARIRSVCMPFMFYVLSPPWTGVFISPASNGLLGPGTAQQTLFLLPPPHNGATLLSVSCSLRVTGPHASVPASMGGGGGPAMQVVRLAIGQGIPTAPQFLSSAPQQGFIPVPASGAAWDSAGQIQTLVYTCNQNNVIDTSQFIYSLILIDENGSGAVAGNIYEGLTLNYTNINDMRFQ